MGYSSCVVRNLSLLMGCAWVSSVAFAQECNNLPSVSLQAVSSEEVSNDMVLLTWRFEVEKPESGQAMQAVNESLSQALARLKTNQEVRHLITNVRTFPVYHSKNRDISHWRGQGTLSFEMALEQLKKRANIEADAAPLVLSGLNYFVSDESKEQGRAKLFGLAIQEFQNKAKLAAKGFGHSGYQLAQLSVNDETNHFDPQPYFQQQDNMRMSAVNSYAEKSVPVSGGVSEIRVSVQGSVCLTQ